MSESDDKLLMPKKLSFNIIITLAALLFVGLFAYVSAQLYYPPIAQSKFPVPVPVPRPSPMPTTTPQVLSTAAPQASVDTRSWGERFRDPTIPQVTGVAWQTYTNKEYGFQLQYPKGWDVEFLGNKEYRAIFFNEPFFSTSPPNHK